MKEIESKGEARDYPAEDCGKIRPREGFFWKFFLLLKFLIKKIGFNCNALKMLIKRKNFFFTILIFKIINEKSSKSHGKGVRVL